MKNDPVLATRDFAKGEFDGEHVPMTLTVNGGLHFIKGNHAPYFSLTCDYHQTGRINSHDGGGAAHELILKYFPEFADLAALHLSDINGEPMYAGANGMYWLAGAMGNPFGEAYTGATGSNAKSPAECLQIFADHVRVTLTEAQGIADEIKRVTLTWANNRRAVARKLLAVECEAYKPRWKAEADACRRKHELVIYGDEWKGE